MCDKKIRIIVGFFSIIVSYLVSKRFFESSVGVMIICFCTINMLIKCYIKNQDVLYKMQMLILLASAIMIILSSEYYYRNLLIVSTMIFSIVFSMTIVREFLIYIDFHN